MTPWEERQLTMGRALRDPELAAAVWNDPAFKKDLNVTWELRGLAMPVERLRGIAQLPSNALADAALSERTTAIAALRSELRTAPTAMLASLGSTMRPVPVRREIPTSWRLRLEPKRVRRVA